MAIVISFMVPVGPPIDTIVRLSLVILIYMHSSWTACSDSLRSIVFNFRQKISFHNEGDKRRVIENSKTARDRTPFQEKLTSRSPKHQ